MKDSYIIGVIGAGNMGEALIKGLLNSQLVRSYEIIASGRRSSRLHKLERSYGIHTTKDNKSILKSTDTIIVAVKPQNIDKLASEIKRYITSNHLIISIAAGIDIKRLQDSFGKQAKYIRAMPNLPAVVDQGISAIYCQPKMPERYRRFAHQILQAVGETTDIHNEKLMDVVTGLSGTGPAYIFAMMEAMISAGKRLGLSQKLSEELTRQTVLGSALLSAENKTPPQELRKKVTSKKGTTWAAMKVFKREKFWNLVGKSIDAATKRSKELRKISLHCNNIK